MRSRAAKAIVAATMLLAAGGCNAAAQGDGGARPNVEIRLYGTDANMANSFGNAFKDSHTGIIAGMKGTVPLTPLSEDFKRRLKAVDPTLADLNYAAEAYDAVVVAALAAEQSKSVEPGNIAKQIIGVTTGDFSCDTLATCLATAKTGKRVRYRGVSLRRSGLTKTGEPSTAMYGVMTFGRDNRLDYTKTEFVSVGDEKAEHKTPAPSMPNSKVGKTNTPLKIGLLLPKTGVLAFLGPPMFAAVRMAVKELNEAGGVLGMPISLEDGDDGTSPDVAGATVDRLVGLGVHVIIGAGASGVSKAVLPKVIAAGKVMISPSATADELSTLDDKGLFFRTSPPDVLQARALTDVVMRYGHTRVAIIARDDSYGNGLAANIQANLTVAGLRANDMKLMMYKAKDRYHPSTDVDVTFNPIALEVKSFGADGILLVGFDESAFVIKALADAGLKVRS